MSDLVTTIWKYPLEVTDLQIIVMPDGAEILTVQAQHDRPCLWVRVNPDNKDTDHVIYTYGTGDTVTDGSGDYIGTYQLQKGRYVFHVFSKRCVTEET